MMVVPSNVNERFESSLSGYKGEVIRSVRTLLGADPETALSASQCELAGYLFIESDTLLRSYFISTGALSVFEINIDGATLSITIPINRIRRVSELRAGGTLSASVEFDADVVRLRGTASVDAGEPGGFSVNIDQRSGSIEFLEATDTDAEARVHEFCQAVRQVISHQR